MKGKYITKQILMACLSQRRAKRKNIHVLLEATIAERKIILKQWEKSFFGVPVKDIHALLAETIAERRKILPRWETLFITEPASYIMEDKKAA